MFSDNEKETKQIKIQYTNKQLFLLFVTLLRNYYCCCFHDTHLNTRIRKDLTIRTRGQNVPQASIQFALQCKSKK